MTSLDPIGFEDRERDEECIEHSYEPEMQMAPSHEADTYKELKLTYLINGGLSYALEKSCDRMTNDCK